MRPYIVYMKIKHSPLTNLCYTLSISSLPLPSSFRASPSLAASSTWANISAISASSSLFLTLYTSSSCFLHKNTTGSCYSWQLQLPRTATESGHDRWCFYMVTPYGLWDLWTDSVWLSLGKTTTSSDKLISNLEGFRCFFATRPFYSRYCALAFKMRQTSHELAQ